MQSTYHCKSCNTTFRAMTTAFFTPCKCGQNAKKSFKDIGLDVEDDSVSRAIEIMKFSSLPSTKDRVAL